MTRQYPTAMTPTDESRTDQVHHQFLTQMSHLQKSISTRNETKALQALHETRQASESLPLATDVYDRVQLRLTNCRRYLISSEYGAAVYELKLLIGTLELKQADSSGPNRHSTRRHIPVVFEPVEEIANWY